MGVRPKIASTKSVNAGFMIFPGKAEWYLVNFVDASDTVMVSEYPCAPLIFVSSLVHSAFIDVIIECRALNLLSMSVDFLAAFKSCDIYEMSSELVSVEPFGRSDVKISVRRRLLGPSFNVESKSAYISVYAIVARYVVKNFVRAVFKVVVEGLGFLN